MKLGEVKIEALKLMFANTGNDIIAEELDSYMLDETYKDYLVNMPGAINRCFSNLEDKRVLPIKSYTLSVGEGFPSGTNGNVRFYLDSIISDIYDIERLVYEKDNEYIGDYEFRREGRAIVIMDFDREASYIVLYRPRLPRITSTTNNAMVLPIPENIATNIAYYIKGDLYRDDEPNEASEARNWYEAAIEQILEGEENKTNKVQSIYSQTEW